jgi:hypothetical protein
MVCKPLKQVFFVESKVDIEDYEENHIKGLDKEMQTYVRLLLSADDEDVFLRFLDIQQISCV